MSAPPLLLTIDVGSLIARCTLFDLDGNVVTTSHRRIGYSTPAPDRQEQDANELWNTIQEMLIELARQHDLAQVAAVGLTNQRGTCLLWDRATGEPLGPALCWEDRRMQSFITALHQAGHALLVQVTTGVTLQSYHSAPKLRWMIDHLPGAGGLLAVGQLAGGTLDSWLLWQLTGHQIHATDYSNAQRTLLFNIATLHWDPELARLFGVPLEILPEVLAGPRTWGTTCIPSLPQLQAPITAVAADHVSALLGQGPPAPGIASGSYGNTIVLLLFHGAQLIGHREGLATIVYDSDGTPVYGMGCAIPGATAAIDWCCNRLGAFTSIEELFGQAATASPDEGIVFVPAFNGLTLPTRDLSARAAILGLHTAADRGSIARAAIESIAFQVADLVSMMGKTGSGSPQQLRVSGKLAYSDLLMQIQADLLGFPIVRTTNGAPASLGIAYLAARGADLPITPSFLDKGTNTTRIFSPQLDSTKRQQRLETWHAGLQRARDWVKKS